MTGSAHTPVGDTSVDAALAAIRRRLPGADPLSRLPDVHPARLPRHVAIIMDGNGRWAEERGFPREFGHRNGAASVRAVLSECEVLGIEAMTLYSFSMENWKRPASEVRALMELCIAYCDGEQQELTERNIKVRVIGRREGLPGDVLRSIDRLVETTSRCTGPTLCLAINYGARAELVDAARSLAADVAAGRLDPAQIDESLFAARLNTDGLPDPDLMIRTGGEHRISNFLLWQLSYAELFVTDVLWPDFGAAELIAAVRHYATRRRRFGGLDSSRSGEVPGDGSPSDA